MFFLIDMLTFVISIKKQQNMSRIFKLSVLFTALFGIIYLFNCSIFDNHKKEIDEQELTQYLLDEYNYEVVFGNENVNTQNFVEQALIEKLQEGK